jgi:hypothetical protein
MAGEVGRREGNGEFSAFLMFAIRVLRRGIEAFYYTCEEISKRLILSFLYIVHSILTERLASSLTDVPLAILRNELARREKDGAGDEDGDSAPDDSGSTCGGNMKKGGYNTSLHVAALVLILLLSTLGMYACS